MPAGQSYTHLAYGAHDVIAAGLDRTIHLIDASSGALLQVIEDAHTQLVYLQWSPVPRRIGERFAPPHIAAWHLCATTSHSHLQPKTSKDP